MHNDIRLQGHGYILNYAAALDVILLGRLSYCHNNMNGPTKEPTNGWTDGQRWCSITIFIRILISYPNSVKPFQCLISYQRIPFMDLFPIYRFQI